MRRTPECFPFIFIVYLADAMDLVYNSRYYLIRNLFLF